MLTAAPLPASLDPRSVHGAPRSRVTVVVPTRAVACVATRTLLVSAGAGRGDALRRAAGDAWPEGGATVLRGLDDLRAALRALVEGAARRGIGMPGAPAAAAPLVVLLDLVPPGAPSVATLRAVLDAAGAAARGPARGAVAARVVACVADVGAALAALADGADECLLPDDAPARWRLVLHREAVRHLEVPRARSASAAPTTDDATPPDASAEALRVVVRVGRRAVALDLRTVRAVESVGNYVRLVAPCGRHLVRGTLAQFAGRLAPLGFVRVHRRTLVRAALVREVVARASGDAVAVLACGLRLRVSRTHRAALERAWRGA